MTCMEKQEKNTLEKIVHSKAFSDASALTMLNTPIVGAIELATGMSLQDSANTRVLTSLTNPLFGMARDYGKRKFKINPKKDRKKSILFDVGMGVATATVEFGAGIGKYALTRYLSGKEINIIDFKAAAYSAIYTAVIGGDLMGLALDSYRHGLDIEKKENGRSLIPKDINAKDKRDLTYGLCALAWSGLEAYYLMSL